MAYASEMSSQLKHMDSDSFDKVKTKYSPLNSEDSHTYVIGADDFKLKYPNCDSISTD